MGKPMIPYDEFRSIFSALKSNKQEEKETQKAYYERLTFDYNIKRSRATLQLVEKAKSKTDDPEKAYEIYQDMTRSRERKRIKKHKTVQMTMSPDDLKPHVSIPDVDPTEDQMEKDAEEIRKEEAEHNADVVMVAFRIVEVAERAFSALLSMINQGGNNNV